eukprot:TRINITY_DN7795_c0_g1_i10.p1 TRINITY_DN7795_c0_g1~~TRINITY_DN7795_c0_g1_i10.p1  ORF type:complete len:370 (+),score=37.32 TRINITY_DN7795_c0_g1_i10:246-1355(+)
MSMDSLVSSFLHSSTVLRQAIRRARDLEALHEIALDLMFQENLQIALNISEQEIKPARAPATEAELSLLEEAGAGVLKGEPKCSICLCEWDPPNEEISMLPGCNHVYHDPCIKKWLQSCNSCPVCRAPVQVGQGSCDTPSAPLETTWTTPPSQHHNQQRLSSERLTDMRAEAHNRREARIQAENELEETVGWMESGLRAGQQAETPELQSFLVSEEPPRHGAHIMSSSSITPPPEPTPNLNPPSPNPNPPSPNPNPTSPRSQRHAMTNQTAAASSPHQSNSGVAQRLRTRVALASSRSTVPLMRRRPWRATRLPSVSPSSSTRPDNHQTSHGGAGHGGRKTPAAENTRVLIRRTSTVTANRRRAADARS